MNYLNLTVAILVGYIVGSIPWALIVGKVFYGVDVRKHGSGNLGGTNVLRTLGKVPGISSIVLVRLWLSTSKYEIISISSSQSSILIGDFS